MEEEDCKSSNYSDDDNNDENESRGTILRFIAQIYSRVNNVNNDKVMGNDPFHRTLYIFACPRPLCSNNQSAMRMKLMVEHSVLEILVISISDISLSRIE